MSDNLHIEPIRIIYMPPENTYNGYQKSPTTEDERTPPPKRPSKKKVQFDIFSVYYWRSLQQRAQRFPPPHGSQSNFIPQSVHVNRNRRNTL